MAKLDLKKQYRELYLPSAKECSVVDVTELQFLMIDGHGDPNTGDEYREALEALYPMSYTLKFLSKQKEDIDYVVMALEGLWWTDDMADFSEDDKSAWSWTSMIMQPSHLTADHMDAAVEQGVYVVYGHRDLGKAYENQGRNLDAARAYAKSMKQGNDLALPAKKFIENLRKGILRGR